MDLLDADENLRLVRERFGSVPVVAVAAESGTGIAELKEQLGKWIDHPIHTEDANSAGSVSAKANKLVDNRT
jgi:50S ribosomal subunit-associated GTPase HflX